MNSHEWTMYIMALSNRVRFGFVDRAFCSYSHRRVEGGFLGQIVGDEHVYLVSFA